jgi:hypothetical protein
MVRVLFVSVVCTLALAAMGSPAAAIKRDSFMHGTACEVKQTGTTTPMVSYMNSGIMVTSASADLICPLPWSKEVAISWQVFDRLDVNVTWLSVTGAPATPPVGSNWGCSLVTETAAGSLFVNPLPIPYPMPLGLSDTAYMALWCTVPQNMGIAGYDATLCFMNPALPTTCWTTPGSP